MNAALRLLASLRLESGKLWIEVATGWQLEDATAIHAPDEGGSTHRTRAAPLTGRNHHTVGMGSITETATSAPGYTSIRPKSTAPLTETLKQNG